MQILQENLNRGRFKRFANRRSPSDPATLSDYIDHILCNIAREYSRIAALEKGDTEAWQQLRDYLAHRALRRLQRFRNGPEIDTEAFDFAHDVCLIVFGEPYPFDVAFDAWTTVILNRLILARYNRSTDALDRPALPQPIDGSPAIDGDGETAPGDLLIDGQSLALFEKVENQSVILGAINRLQSLTQRRVIRYTYFQELDDAQIAKRLGKSKQAVYNLRKRALGRLKEILTEMGLQE